MTKAENSRVARNEPSADRIAADLAITSPGAGNALSSANLGGGDNDKPAAPNFSATVVIDTVSDKGAYAQHFTDTACMGATL